MTSEPTKPMSDLAREIALKHHLRLEAMCDIRDAIRSEREKVLNIAIKLNYNSHMAECRGCGATEDTMRQEYMEAFDKLRNELGENIQDCHHYSDGSPIFPARHKNCGQGEEVGGEI